MLLILCYLNLKTTNNKIYQNYKKNSCLKKAKRD